MRTTVSLHRSHGALLAFALSVAPVLADWPWWRGPTHNGASGETLFDGAAFGLSPPVWKHDAGEGCSSVAASGGRVYSTGWSGGQETVFCLAADDGSVLWSKSDACPRYGRFAEGDQNWYSGPTSSPVLDVDTGLLYTLSADGDLRCRDTAQAGELRWEVNLYDRYGVQRRPDVGGGQRDYGFTTAPLVLGDLLLVAVGPPEGLVVALEKQTGSPKWASTCKDFAANCGGMSPLRVAGIPCVAVLSLTRLVIVRLDGGLEGATLAEHPWQTDYANNLVSPTVVGECVLLSSDYNIKRTVLLRVTPTGIAPVWESQRFSGVGSPAVHSDHLYLAFNKLRCLRLADGEEVWSGGNFGPDASCLVTADGYVVAGGSGKLAVVEAASRNAGAYREVASRDGLCGKNQAWPHVVFADGRVYHKDRQGRITCLGLRAGAGRTVEETTARAVAPLPGGAPAEPGAVLLSWRAGEPANGLQARGAASVAKDGSLELSGGSFELTGLAERLLAACRTSHALTVDVEFTAADTQQGGPARIVSFSVDPYRRNFTLGQERDRLVLRLRTPETGDNGMNPETTLGTVVAGRRHHVTVRYVPGRLTCQMDGEETVDSDAVRGDFSNWELQPMLVGNEASNDRAWSGRLHALLIGAGASSEPVPAAEPPVAPAAERSARAAEPLSAGVSEGSDVRGRPTLTIATPKARFVYDMNGGGLASLLDAEGRDWIGHSAVGGARGAYRGIPNLIDPEGGFHPGDDRCVSRVETVPGVIAAVRSDTTDGLWASRWAFFDGYAVMTLEKATHSYWFLYEGTPGGRYDEARTWMMDSAKVRTRATERWERRLPDPRWIAFGCDGLSQAVFLADLDLRPAEVTDSFWSMERSMTVFGFGRSLQQGGRWHHLREVPARFVVGLVEGSDLESLAASIEETLRSVRSGAGG